MQRKKEEHAYVLDFLPNGYPFETQRVPVVQLLGEKFLSLLEATPKNSTAFGQKEKVYIGGDRREKIHHIVGRIQYSKLTQNARFNLQELIESMIDGDTKPYVDFFNKAGPVSMRLHELELIPGIGKKHMWKILEEREEKPFESFEDIKKRVDFLPDPKKTIVKRIMLEFEGGDKYRLFIN